MSGGPEYKHRSTTRDKLDIGPMIDPIKTLSPGS